MTRTPASVAVVVMVNESPGATARRNFRLLTRFAGPGRPPMRAASLIQAPSTAPGTRGFPGKCPSQKKIPPGTVKVIRQPPFPHSTVGDPGNSLVLDMVIAERGLGLGMKRFHCLLWNSGRQTKSASGLNSGRPFCYMGGRGAKRIGYLDPCGPDASFARLSEVKLNHCSGRSVSFCSRSRRTAWK